MMEFKFPHTPHLAWLGSSTPRSDKVLSRDEVRHFLSSPVVVEEKLDGANIGIAFDESGGPVVKNRGTVLGPGSHRQFQALWPWLAARQGALRREMGEQLALFGEWCFAVHSMRYRHLPDYFIAFDIYDRTAERFWSAERRDEWAHSLGIVTAPIVARGSFTLPDLTQLLLTLPSRFGSEAAEGLYLRQDRDEWLLERAKLVRPEFMQAIEEHWMKRPLERNAVSR